jgi:hypothetical protein
MPLYFIWTFFIITNVGLRVIYIAHGIQRLGVKSLTYLNAFVFHHLIVVPTDDLYRVTVLISTEQSTDLVITLTTLIGENLIHHLTDSSLHNMKVCMCL